MKLRPLTADDAEQAWNLSLLAFGGDPEAPPQPGPPGPAVGAFDERGRLLAAARARPYHQWWCGLPVPMAGIAGVAVHPDARGQGLVGRLMDALVGSAEQPVSALFPTAPRIYRRLGWEVVGRLDHTVVPVSSLPRAAQVPLRGATPGDLTALTALYDERGRAGSGLLTRTGPSFAKGPAGLLEHQVVTLAVEDGIVVGYLAYDRGRGYRGGASLRVWECVTASPSALRSLLAGLAGWEGVVDTVTWRGRTDDLALALDRSLPPPSEVQPWMLRVLDPVAAVAARGFGPGEARVPFAVDGVGYLLEVADGRGRLTPTAADGLPVVTAQGLALLYAGMAQGRLLRAGLLDRPAPALEAAFAGPVPEILDYF